jgi:Asp/Glu/hydantoin racemase
MAAPLRQLLVINPNTSEDVSSLLRRHVQAAAGADVRVRVVTARFGAPYIADEASHAVAGHAVLDAWSAALAEPNIAPPDAVLIGCFGDPGLLALRECSPAPVTALAEAAFIEAARHGRFAIVTGGARWAPMLRRLALVLDHGPALAGIHTVALTGAQLAADPQPAQALLAQACRDAVRHSRADAVIIGGAGLAGMAAMLQPAIEVPLVDSVSAGTRWALSRQAPGSGRASAGFDTPWDNVSAEMERLGSTRQ